MIQRRRTRPNTDISNSGEGKLDSGQAVLARPAILEQLKSSGSAASCVPDIRLLHQQRFPSETLAWKPQRAVFHHSTAQFVPSEPELRRTLAAPTTRSPGDRVAKRKRASAPAGRDATASEKQRFWTPSILISQQPLGSVDRGASCILASLSRPDGLPGETLKVLILRWRSIRPQTVTWETVLTTNQLSR